MSIEEALAANTAALVENTAAHLKLAAVAEAARKPVKEAEPPKEEEAPKLTAAQKAAATKAAAKAKADEEAAAEEEAPKKAAPKKTTKKVETPDPVTDIAEGEVAPLVLGFIKTDDEELRDERKAKVRAALDHIGAAKATEIEDDEGRCKFATYVAYWTAGLEVDFEAVDELVTEAMEAAGGEGSDEDDLV